MATMNTNIKINIVEPGSSTPVDPTPIDPVPTDPSDTTNTTNTTTYTSSTDVSVPDTGLFTHGIGGTEATIITISTIALLLTIIATIVTVLYKKHKKQGKVTKLVRTIEQTKTIIKSKKRISSALSAIALLASVGTLAILLANSNKTNTNAMEGGTELTVDVNSEELTIEVGDTPVFAYLPVKLTVEEATTSGYILSAYAEDTNLVSTTDESNIIPMVAIPEPIEPNEEGVGKGWSPVTTLTDNTWGLSLEQPQDQNSEVYTILSTDQSNPTILKSIDDYSETEENDTTTIYYGFYITPDTPKGTYEGSNITYTALTNPPVATVTFDGNGLYFNDNEEQTTNTIKYIPNVPTSQTVAYSHTPNVNDEGEQDGIYGRDLNATEVYRFADTATKVHVKIVQSGNDSTCGPNSDDYFTFWSGAHSDYTAKANYTSAVRAFGNTNGQYMFDNYNNVEIDLDGTTAVTFAYTTNGYQYCSGTGYGYYAIITAQDVDGNNVPVIANNSVAGNYTVPTTEATHRFLGWSTDKNALIGAYTSADDFENYVFNSPDEKVTMYAIWDPIIEITYNGNGADDTTDMANVNQYTTDFTTAGRTVDLLASNYQRAGYGFIGWSEDKDAYTKLVNGEDVTIYGPNETLTIGREMQQRMSQTGKLELNAIWAEVAKDSQGNDLTFQTDDLLTTELADGTTLATKPNGYVTALKDSRDNEVYAVAKLADGNYWMIENLRLDNSSELSLQNTNNPSLPLTNDYNAGTTSNFLSATSDSWCTSSNAQCNNQSKLNTNNTTLATTSPEFSQNYTNGAHSSDFNTNLHSYGNYYNWYSATAGRGTYETDSYEVVVGDICPAGWQLPYGGSGDTNNGKGNTSGGFYYLNNLLGNSSNAWRSFPNNFIYSGYWYNSQTSSRGNYGYYWASTTSGTSSAYNLYFYNSYVGSTSSNSKYYGSSVRCVAPIQTTITFDGNGSTSGEMAKQKIGANSAAPLNQNTFTKNDYAFASWNTERDGSGTSYADRQDFTAGEGINNVTLYAQWADCVPNKICYKSNGANSPTTMDPQSASSSTDVELWASNYKYDTNNDGHNDYGFAGWSEDKDAATKLTDNNPDNNPVVYGPNQTITTGDLSLEGMKLYAVWIAPKENTTFQDFICPNNTDMPKGTVIALRDNRDNEVYTVAKLADGNCWMTENLRLDNNATINATNTNNPISSFTVLSPSSDSWCTSTSSSCFNQSILNSNNIANTVSPMTGTDANIYSYSNYYNWYSATAGNGTRSISSGTVAGDLCPAGWHLPYGGNETSAKGGNTSGGFYYLNQQMGAATGAAGSNNWRSFPNNFVYSGYWYGSSAYYRGNYGYYWSSTAGNTSSAYNLYFHSGYVNPTNSSDKYYGHSVRCVAPVGTTITFDGNGSTGGEMSKQRIAQNTTAPLNSNKFTKDEYFFGSWNTERDGSGTSYADGQDFTAGEGNNNITLYTQWVECAPNSICYKPNGANSPTTIDPQSASSNTDVELWASNYKYDTNNDGHNDYGFAGWSEDKDAAAKLVDNDSTNNPVVYGPNQTITTGDLSLEGMKLYAVWIAPEENTSFQDFTCPNNTDMPIGTVIALRDNRDNEVYTVAKLADGNCWMTENLRLDNNATINATNTNSPISTFTALSPSSNSWCEDNSESCINQSMLNTNNIAKSVSPMTGTDANIYSYGNYYNWYSATAGNGTYSTGWNVTVAGDLCPAGWHLPYGGNETSAKGGNTSGGFYYLNQQMGGVTSTQGSKNWRSFPNNFVYSGGWYGSSAGYRGRYGYYRSSTALSTGYAYHLNFGSDYVDQGTSGNRMSYAYSVRCVAPVE